MVSSLTLLSLALTSALPALGAPSDKKCGFDYDSLSLREVGARNTLDWRIWLEKDGDPISFWHDVPLYPYPNNKTIVNYYVEIPRWTDGKIETKRTEPLNPIFHDDKKDKPRFVASVWPHKTYPFLYGSMPQTWENSQVEHNFTGYVGDNDPMDIFDISGIQPGYVGEVRQVKVLGGLAMIDDDATDWKVIAVDLRDPLARQVETVDDLEKFRPGMKKTFYDWFTYYKVVKGSGLNTITGDKFQDATLMNREIAQSHEWWKDLVQGKVTDGKIDITQTSKPDYKEYVKSNKATEKLDLPEKSDVKDPAERPGIYDYWYYLDEDFNVIQLPGQDIDVI